ncbi:hypothetical protein [Emticicia soli]|uniref:Peptidase C-terminal archaeal/bacterial domain-containing protein n=1 Tax=Emticicia soli TaxID=2027878 RepID=A0ABW5JB55_9BACT
MKTSLFFILLLSLMLGCSPEESDPKPDDPDPTGTNPKPTDPKPNDPVPTQPVIITGEWVAAKGGAGGIDNFDSFKNYHFNFEVVTNNTDITIQLSSADINIKYALFNPLGEKVNQAFAGRSHNNTFKVNAGKYRVVVSAERRAVGKFALKVLGAKTPVQIASKLLQSGTQTWGALGGGGIVKTFKNHFYTFEVTEENSYIDLTIQSPDTEVALVLFDDLGQVLYKSYAFHNRYEFTTPKVRKGVYTVMAATEKRGSMGNYTLEISGQVDKLTKINSQTSTLNGRWNSKTSVDVYQFEMTSANLPIDFELSSADTKVVIKFQTEVGAEITKTLGLEKVAVYVSGDLPKKTFRVAATPANNGTAGNYTLKVVGQFANLKKL